MNNQNQHYVNKSLIKRFSADGETINTIHLFHRQELVHTEDGYVKSYRNCSKQSEINENVRINDLAFCSHDPFSDKTKFWSTGLESLLNDKIENNLINILFDQNERGQQNKMEVQSCCPLLGHYGISVEQIELTNKFKSRINAFMHILTVSSHYELFLSEETLLEYIKNIDAPTRLSIFKDFKLFHIKFDKHKSKGRFLLDEFPARYVGRSDRPIDYANPPIDNGDIIVGEYEILLICKDIQYLYNFLIGNIVFTDDYVDLELSNCVSYYQGALKSRVFASSDKEQLINFVELFNSESFRDYVSITKDRFQPIISKRNHEVTLLRRLYQFRQIN